MGFNILQISFKKIESKPELEAIKNLYITAFPPNERREFDELKKQVYNGACHINLILIGEKIAGFIILWNFTGFVFLEHFAIVPELRGQGTGEKAIAEIKTRFQKTIILETEPPVDELNRRRIRFYERNGFHILKRTYFQPSYGGNKPEIELKLMCTKDDFTVEELDFIIQSIRGKVYGA